MADDSVYPWSLANTSYTMVDGLPVFMQIRASADRIYDCVHFGMGGTAMTSFHISVYKITSANTLTLLRSLGNVKSSLSASTLGGSELARGTATPVVVGAGSYEIGTRIQFNVAGSITALKFYRPSGDTVTSRVMHVWSTGGTLLATSNASNETGMYGTGQWVNVTLSAPIAVAANDNLVISRPDTEYFCYTSSPLPTYAADFTFVQGQYNPTVNAYPSSINGNDYATDVVFSPTIPNFEQSLFLTDPIDVAAGEDLYVGFLAVGGTMPVWFASNLIAPNTTETMGDTPTLNQITAVASAGSHTDLTASTKTLSTVLATNAGARIWGALGNYAPVPRMPAFYVDTFNRVNAPALLQPWGGNPNVPRFAIYNSTASPVVDATYGTYSYWIPTLRSDDHYAQVKLGMDMASNAPNPKDFYLGVRSSRGVLGPAVKLHINPDGTFRIVNVTTTYNNTGLTQRATAASSLTFSLGDVIKIVASSTIYTAFHNDALICSWVDSGVIHPVSADQRWVDMTMPITATANLQIADNFEAGDFGGGVQLVSPPLLSDETFYATTVTNNVTVSPAPAVLTLVEQQAVLRDGVGIVAAAAELILAQQPATVSVPTVTVTETNQARTNYAFPAGTVGVWITLIGGGGSGGAGGGNDGATYSSGGSGGSGGSSVNRTFIRKSVLGSTYTAVFGAGAAHNLGNGLSGGASSFSSGSVSASAPGGPGGLYTSGVPYTPNASAPAAATCSGFTPSSTSVGGIGSGTTGNGGGAGAGAGGGGGGYNNGASYFAASSGGSSSTATGGSGGNGSNVAGSPGGDGSPNGAGGGGGSGFGYNGGNGGAYGGGGGGGASAQGQGGAPSSYGGVGGVGLVKIEFVTS